MAGDKEETETGTHRDGDGRSVTLVGHAAAGLSTRELIARISAGAGELLRTEVDLAKAELRQDVAKTKALAGGVATAAVLAIFGVATLLATAILGLATVLPAWAAAGIVTLALFGGAAAAFWLGWRRRARQPLEATRREVKESVRLVKEQLA